MNSRWRGAILALLVGVLALGLALPALADDEDTGWTIESFDAHLEVNPDGSVQVREQIAVDFAALARHGIFRVIPVRYAIPPDDTQVQLPEGRDPGDFRRLLEISDIRVDSSAPADVETDRRGDNLVLRIGDEDVTVTGPQTYTLRYTVRGALNAVDDGAELVWDVTGDEWPVPILQATAEVEAPQVSEFSCARGPSGTTAPCEQGPGAEGQPAFRAGPLAPGEGMTVAAGFPPGTITVPPPLIEERWTLSRALAGSPAALPLAAVTAVAGLGGVALLVRRGRDRTDPADPALAGGPGPRFAPPDGLRPAQLRVVLEEWVDGASLTATLMDLAARGFLDIEHLPPKGGRRKPDWRLTRRDDGDPSTLLDYERHLLDHVFFRKDERMVSKLRGKFWKQYAIFRDLVYRDAVDRGWFRRSPVATRTRWLSFGILAVVVTGVLLGLALAFTTVAAAVVPLVLAAVALLFVHRWMPSRTPAGRRLLDETRGYRDFLKSQTAPQADPSSFARDLPYAVAFGAAPALVARFAALGLPPERWAPGYYHYPAGYAAWHQDPSAVSADLATFTRSVGSTLSTAPSSTGGGGGGSGGSVSSGGGFGGGGGGSW